MKTRKLDIIERAKASEKGKLLVADGNGANKVRKIITKIKINNVSVFLLVSQEKLGKKSAGTWKLLWKHVRVEQPATASQLRACEDGEKGEI